MSLLLALQGALDANAPSPYAAGNGVSVTQQQRANRQITASAANRAWVNLDAAVAASSDLSIYAQSKAQSKAQSTVGRTWVDLSVVDAPIYAQSVPKPLRLKPFANVWNDLDFASDVPSTVAQSQVKRVATKNSGSAWVDLSDLSVVSDAPIYAQSLSKRISKAITGGAAWVDLSVVDAPIYAQSIARTARPKPIAGAWNDLDFASDVPTIVAQSKPQRALGRNTGASWVDRDIPDAPIYAQSNARFKTRQAQSASWVALDATLAASSDLSPYAQANHKRQALRITSLAWTDLGVSGDAPIYAQSTLPRGNRNLSTGSAWVDLDVVENSPYAQSTPKPRQLVLKGGVWTDNDFVVAPSSPIYAQSAPKKQQQAAKSSAWVELIKSDDVPIYAQSVAKPVRQVIHSAVWFDTFVSSDNSPYAQTSIHTSALRVLRRGTGGTWSGVKDFFPPQDDLSAYGQSTFSQHKIVTKPQVLGRAWVDLEVSIPLGKQFQRNAVDSGRANDSNAPRYVHPDTPRHATNDMLRPGSTNMRRPPNVR